MEQYIQQLEQRIKKLEDAQSPLVDKILDQIVLSRKGYSSATQSVGAGGGDVSVPTVRGSLEIMYKGQRYPLLYG